MERRDYWEKEYLDPDRDRTRGLSYMHPPSSLKYGHGSSALTPGTIRLTTIEIIITSFTTMDLPILLHHCHLPCIPVLEVRRL